MPNKIFISVFFVLIISVFLSFNKFNTGIKRRITVHIPDKVKSVFSEPSYFAEVPSYINNDSTSYFHRKNDFETFKKHFKNEYLNANSSDEKTKILNLASEQLYTNLVDSLIPHWYGTPWDYNGISQKPGSGQIACGYFVFTLMRDAGMKLPRIKMSQAASEQAIKSLLPNTQINRFSNTSIKYFVSKMQSWGDGFYIIGLDNHIGLLQVKDNETWFIHSTVIYPSCVLKEKARNSPALEQSSYRVVGKLSDYNSLTKKWLFNEYISLK